MKRRILLLVAALAVMGLVLGQNAWAGVKERMVERLPEIVELKAQGVVGENNEGFLEFIGDEKKKQDLVAAENADRKIVYQAIAKQQGVSVEVVGKRRAMQIRNKAKPGEWLQDPSGKWYQQK
ncbi:MAG: YdbL family protein [Desulfatibacillaceae bacterium]